MSSIADVLFKEYRRKVLGLLLLKPDEAFHVREIARLTSTQPGTLHKELSKLAEVGILKKSEQGNQVLYQADTTCVVFEELASIMRKTSGLFDVIRMALQPLNKSLIYAGVFGSVASGKATSGSDVDVLLIGNIGYGDAVKALYAAQSEVGREINPKLYSLEEWRNACTEQSSFIQQVMNNPLLSIIGNIDDVR